MGIAEVFEWSRPLARMVVIVVLIYFNGTGTGSMSYNDTVWSGLDWFVWYELGWDQVIQFQNWEVSLHNAQIQQPFQSRDSQLRSNIR
jgi:hypothetical protein